MDTYTRFGKQFWFFTHCGLIVVIWLPAAFFSALPGVLLNLLARRYRIQIRFFTFLWDVV